LDSNLTSLCGKGKLEKETKRSYCNIQVKYNDFYEDNGIIIKRYFSGDKASVRRKMNEAMGQLWLFE
jgi:hypothetical protein